MILATLSWFKTHLPGFSCDFFRNIFNKAPMVFSGPRCLRFAKVHACNNEPKDWSNGSKTTAPRRGVTDGGFPFGCERRVAGLHTFSQGNLMGHLEYLPHCSIAMLQVRDKRTCFFNVVSVSNMFAKVCPANWTLECTWSDTMICKDTNGYCRWANIMHSHASLDYCFLLLSCSTCLMEIRLAKQPQILGTVATKGALIANKAQYPTSDSACIDNEVSPPWKTRMYVCENMLKPHTPQRRSPKEDWKRNKIWIKFGRLPLRCQSPGNYYISSRSFL